MGNKLGFLLVKICRPFSITFSLKEEGRDGGCFQITTPLTATLLTLIGKGPYVPICNLLRANAPKNPQWVKKAAPISPKGRGKKD